MGVCEGFARMHLKPCHAAFACSAEVVTESQALGSQSHGPLGIQSDMQHNAPLLWQQCGSYPGCGAQLAGADTPWFQNVSDRVADLHPFHCV